MKQLNRNQSSLVGSKRTLSLLCSLALLLGLAACDADMAVPETINESVSEAVPMGDNVYEYKTLDEWFLEIDQEVGGFAGMYENENGELVVSVTDDQLAPAAVARVSGDDAMGKNSMNIVVNSDLANFRFGQLFSARERIREEALQMKIAMIDIDERANTVSIGLQPGSDLKNVTDQIAALGLPAAMVHVYEAERVETAAGTLTGQVRPMKGGIELNFGSTACTYGFAARLQTQYGFITNSHCTNVQGGVENTNYNQGGQFVGIETLDPAYPGVGGGGSGGAKNGSMGLPCPTGYRCRRSDAAYARFAGNTTNQDLAFARITRTYSRGPVTGSLSFPEFDGNYPFTITSVETSHHLLGSEMNKVGRTSGWTYGNITDTCADINPFGTDIMLLCQYKVSGGVQPGDSGSPVFSWDGSSNSVELEGLLWGKIGGSFLFSSFAAVQAELNFFDPINP